MGIELRGCCPLLQVFDMPTAVEFYREILGFEIKGHSLALSDQAGDFNFVLLDRKGTELMLNTAYDEGERPPAPNPARVAAHGDTCVYFGWEDLDGLYAELRAKGAQAREPESCSLWDEAALCDRSGWVWVVFSVAGHAAGL